ncbi:efflux RND transporter periplasmic adaptor subunit [Thalassotalea sp. ND16A]|uniref:efflux RND transporter periplasmic adaptor subunit n=1 Tax=Thalassotalea sp. ND16A TaxID=1535422 RepID=UPI00068D31DA|nr:efflux RND transporter periplasmic adaptor subunit [Thalassotalea sp. ND16A]
MYSLAHKHLLVALFHLALFHLALVWLWPTPLAAQQAPAATPVNVTIAALKELAPTIKVSGTVISPSDAQISARTIGVLTALAEVGDNVSEGQNIATIDNQILLLTAQQQIAQISSIKHRLSYLSKEVKRLQSLASNNLTSKTEMENTSTEHAEKQSELEAAKTRLAQIKVEISYLQLKAPFAGIITSRLSHVGERVEPGTNIVRLVATSTLEITAAVPVSAYAYIKKEMKLAVTSTLGSIIVPVRSLVAVADQRSRLMELRLNLQNTRWPVGLNVKVSIPNGERQKVLAVARDALIIRRDGVSVFRINADNSAERLSVNLGRGSGAYIEIIGDIRPGDKIVIRGGERLRPGQMVTIKTNNSDLVIQ